MIVEVSPLKIFATFYLSPKQYDQLKVILKPNKFGQITIVSFANDTHNIE